MSAAPNSRPVAIAGAASVSTLDVQAWGALGDADDGFALLAPDGTLASCNDAWRKWHERALDRPVTPGTPLAALLAGDGAASHWLAAYRAHLHAADGGWMEFQWCADEWARACFVPAADGAMLARIENISARRRREAVLHETAERFRSYAETSGDWFWELDLTGRCRFASSRQRCDAKLDAETLIGQHFLDWLRRLAVDASDIEPIARSIAARQPFRECEVRLCGGDDSEIVSSMSGIPFAREDGQFAGYRGTGRNVTEAHRLARRLVHQANHDDLTGLVNRRGLEERIASVLAENGNNPVQYALCFLDVDQIKVVNDTCGHAAGDALINRVAALLCKGVRRADTVARLGGDEFGVLLRDCDPARAERVANKIRKGLAERPFTWDGQQFRVTVSIGVAPLGRDLSNAADVLRAADSACYAAKERGRNRVKLYAMDDSTLNIRQGEMHWVARIHAALADKRFALHLQPIVATLSGGGEHRHFETLIRLNGRDGRSFLPGAFLPAAERYNLASQIDTWVVDEVLGWLERSVPFLDRLDALAVNLSGRSLGEAAFLSGVVDRMRRHPRAAAKLCFEITETAAIANLEDVQKFMASMRAFGCRFSLDDFGAGMSSFAYLRTLDVDYLKIDGMFVKDIHEDPVHEAMVRAINEVGHVMGKKTIAEFVENDEVRTKLADIGVDYVQGFGIGKPVPFDDVV